MQKNTSVLGKNLIRGLEKSRTQNTKTEGRSREVSRNVEGIRVFNDVVEHCHEGRFLIGKLKSHDIGIVTAKAELFQYLIMPHYDKNSLLDWTVKSPLQRHQ